MPRKLILLLAALLLTGFGYQAASAADLGYYGRGNGLGTHHAMGFWGEAYPFGYNWSYVRACTRYEPVETKYGTRTEKVWVCGNRRWGR